MVAPLAHRPIARILLVNDDPTVADSCARALRLDGHEVWAALSADDGVRLARTHAPHAVVVDVRAPLACTAGLVERLRKLPHLEAASIAVVSGDRHPARATLELLGALDIQLRYKPVWLNELVALSRSLVRPA